MMNAIAVASMIGVVTLTGCVNTSGVLEIGRDTYSVSATSDGLRAASSGRASAFEAGQAKCAAEGKHFLLVNEVSRRTRMNIDTTTDVTFRCLDANHPAYTRPNVEAAPNVVNRKQAETITTIGADPLTYRPAVCEAGRAAVKTLAECADNQGAAKHRASP